MKEVKNRFYEFGEFRIDARERLLSKNGAPVPINFKSFDVLLVLIQNSGHLLEKEELMRLVWDEAIVEEANLKNCVSALRKALGDTPSQSLYIQTLPKLGYKFVAPVISLPDEKAASMVERHTLIEVLIEKESVTLSEDEMFTEAASNGQAILAEAISDADIAGLERVNLIKVAAGKAPGCFPGKEVEALLIDSVSTIPEMAKSSKPLSTYQKPVAIATAILLLGLGAFLTFKLWFALQTKPSMAFDKIKMTRLTDIGNGFTVISPDGKYLAYVSGDQTGNSLSVKQLDSNQVMQLLPKAKRSILGISFSADNRKLYCSIVDEANPTGALTEIPVSGEAPKKLFDGVNTKASLSPDGKRLVFRRTDTAMGKNMVVAINLDGSDEQVLLQPSMRYVIYDCIWSPSGKTITLILWLMNDDGNRPWQIVEIPATGGAIKPITQLQNESITSISWMPDESGLVMASRQSKQPFRQIWFVSYPDGNIKKITNDLNDYAYVLVTDTGKAIFAAHNSHNSTVWVGDSEDLSRARKLNLASGYYTGLQWMPDGRILYNYAADIWTMSADGDQRQRLTADAGTNSYATMSKDGRYIAFLSNRSGRYQVWRMHSDGSNARQLTYVPNDADAPHFSSDGQWVFYDTWLPVGWTVWKVPVEGGNPVQLTFKDTESFSVSPDGKQLAYTFYDEVKKRKLMAFKSTEGGEPNRVHEFPALESYSIVEWGNRGLLCTNKACTELFLLSVDGGKPEQLTDFKTGERLNVALSADGKKLAFARIAMNNEVVLITDFR